MLSSKYLLSIISKEKRRKNKKEDHKRPGEKNAWEVYILQGIWRRK